MTRVNLLVALLVRQVHSLNQRLTEMSMAETKVQDYFQKAGHIYDRTFSLPPSL